MKYSLSSKGDWKKTFDFFDKSMRVHEYAYKSINEGAKAGVKALASSTPKDTGRAASSWGFEIERSLKTTDIFWTNSDIENGFFNVIMGLQYGHGTGTGGFVSSRDFINPAMKSIYKVIADAVWKEVTK